ncbi:ABC-F family ATP-binding cassette domain-containing protein [Fuchsiella alkaliacetigena]|uniref:ABC-F family ATP-binding cassette domain-containing protein n=1 Tax=Fuchsiella alkaliacetigena TaxID=957042 RepID=UPI00200BA144|nr:ABC-F family ATP-binding cassette domain-containing protein [Fuchsiella alkaliacetigena]MCK8825425.1 ATP-binding cassette domain-containing protein [Fuchsiella alkaliacetigena]
MSLLQLRGATKVYPAKKLFSDLSLQIQPEDSIGLIGVNGSGKSTLLKVLAKEEHLSSGELLESNGLQIGYLAQDSALDLEATLYQEMLGVYEELFELEEKMNSLEERMSQVTGNELEKVMARYSRLREEYEQREGYQYQSQLKGVLKGLGFSEADFEKRIANFSGGQKTRAALAKLLLEEPDLLLLDEPTNHLDLQAKEWLEEYLVGYSQAVVIISHDRHFLDRVVERIWELEKGRFEKYNGNYSFYLEEKERRLLTWQREYQKQQKKIAKMKKYIRQNIAGVDSKQARGRRKQLERLEEIPPPPKLKQPQINFELTKESGREVLVADGLSMSYEEEVLFTDLDFRVYKGEKIALVGPNGSGKSTLLKLIAGREEAQAGSIKLGSNVELAYYDQEYSDLEPEHNLIEELETAKSIKESQARDLLARFLFQDDDVFKQVATLSGGEKARLALAKLTLQEHNLLLLDEPTNHLDIRSKEILESALQRYPGTILLVSHARYFMDSLVDQVWALDETGLAKYKGNYSAYRREQQRLKEVQAKVEAEETSVQLTNEEESAQPTTPSEEKLDLEELEKKIMELESRLAELAEKFDNQDLYEDEDRLAALSKEYEELEEKLADYYALWEQAI